MIQLGTDPFCIIFQKWYKRGLSPIVSFYQAMVGGVEDGNLTVVAESAAGIEAVGGIVIGVNGYGGQGYSQFSLLAEHLMDQGRCYTIAAVLGQDGKRVKIVFAGTGLIVHGLIVITYVSSYHRECHITHLAVSGAVVGYHHTGRHAVIQRDCGVTPAVERIIATAYCSQIFNMFILGLVNMQCAQDILGYKAGIGNSGLPYLNELVHMGAKI